MKQIKQKLQLNENELVENKKRNKLTITKCFKKAKTNYDNNNKYIVKKIATVREKQQKITFFIYEI